MRLPISKRAPPPHFAGRKSELTALNRRLDDMLRLRSYDDGLALITGVPGAGKTQLGWKFAQQVRQREDVDARCLFVEPEMLVGPLDLFKAIGEALATADAFRAVAEIDTRTVSRGGGLGPVKASFTQEPARHTGEFAALLRASQATGAWEGKALVLLVDEVQGVQPAGMVALRVLHQGLHGCPVLPVGIGLQHTPGVLANPPDGSPGISRLATRLRLGSLSRSEACEAIALGMDAIDLPIDERYAVALAEASFGFPHHIHDYLEGACEAIEKHGALDSDAALATALEIGHQKRSEYYNDRLGVLAPRHRAAMLGVAAAMRDSCCEKLTWLDAAAATEKTEGVHGDDAVGDAVRHGVLTEDEEGNLSFGIPSFHSHMRQRLERL